MDEGSQQRLGRVNNLLFTPPLVAAAAVATAAAIPAAAIPAAAAVAPLHGAPGRSCNAVVKRHPNCGAANAAGECCSGRCSRAAETAAALPAAGRPGCGEGAATGGHGLPAVLLVGCDRQAGRGSPQQPRWTGLLPAARSAGLVPAVIAWMATGWLSGRPLHLFGASSGPCAAWAQPVRKRPRPTPSLLFGRSNCSLSAGPQQLARCPSPSSSQGLTAAGGGPRPP